MHKLRIQNIEQKIIPLRKMSIILDRDLAVLYDVETRVLKQAVNRNIQRFPKDFMFQLTENEINVMVSQSVIPSKKYFGGAKPYAFTEQGVAMLSAVLRSPIAIEVSIKIMNAFVKMRQLAGIYAQLTQQVDQLEIVQRSFEIKTNTRFDRIFETIGSNNVIPTEGIFYDGQIFDAYAFVANIIKSAKQSIILIDNYVDETVLILLSKRNVKAHAKIYTKTVSKQLKLDLKKHNAQYPLIEVKRFSKSHDRFLIIDEKTIYHIGASLKDLGNKWFAFSRIKLNAKDLIDNLNR